VPEPAWRRFECGSDGIIGARFRAGFAHFRFPWIYNVRIPRAQQILGVDRKVHTAEHLASAAFYLGAARMEIPRAKLFAGQARARTGPAIPPYAVLHPVAAGPAKTWPAERFVAVASHLQQSFDLQPVFIGGPGDDLSRFANGARLWSAA